MKTVPDIITTEARRGELFYAVEILPNAGETWDALRWATKECRIDGDEYEGGAITKVGRISYRADVKIGGSAATRDRVELTARNIKADGSSRFQELAEQPIGGRKISIKCGCVPPNLVKNSSFEDETGGIFDHWVEFPGVGGSIQQVAGGIHGTYRCQIYSASSAEKSFIRTENITCKRGQPLTVSFYLEALTAGDQCEIHLRIDGIYDWVISTQQWVLASAVTATYTPPTGSMTRYSFTIPAGKMSEMFQNTTKDDLPLTLDFNAAGEMAAIYVDGVMISPRDYLIDYIPAMHDLTSSDVIDQYTGEVFDYDLTNQKIRIITRSMASLRHRRIPITALDEQLVAALSANWIIPPHNIGKAVPITYGAFNPMIKTKLDQRQPGKVPALGILCNYIDGGAVGDEVRILFDRPGGVIHHHGYYDVYVWDGEGQQWHHQLYDDRVTPVYVASEFVESAYYCAMKAASGCGYLNNGRMPISLYQRAREVIQVTLQSSTDAWVNPENSLIFSVSEFASRVTTADNGSSDIEYSFEPITIRDGTLIDAYLIIALWHYVTAITGGTVWLQVNAIDTRSPGYSETLTLLQRTVTGGDTWDNRPSVGGDRETDYPFAIAAPTDTLAWWGDSGLSLVPEIKSAHTGASGTWTGEARCFTLEFRLDVSLDLLEADLFGRINGRSYLSTWESRKTAGGFIQVCSDTIESLLRDELGIAGADIDTDSFDDCYTARSGAGGIHLAGQVTEFTDSENVIGEMCSSCGLMYYNDLNGKEKLVALDKKAVQDKTIGYGDLIEDTLKVRFSRRDEVITDFVLNFGYNPISEGYHMRHYCNKDGSSFSSGGATYEALCQDAYDAIGLKVLREFNFKWLNDDASAQNQLKFLVNWFTYLKCFAEFETYYDMVGIELGDQLLLNFPYHMPSTTDDSFFVVESISAKESARRIRLQLIEIRDAV